MSRLSAFWRSTAGLALLGSLLMALAQPPVHWWLLAWVAPAPWVYLARREALGRRPWLALWLAGCAYWLATLHWLRLPHWTTHFGWLALSFYLAIFVPVFVAVVRVAVHRLKISVVVAAPIAWYGLELARGHLLTGFTMGSLSQTQVTWLPIIQIADVVGAYGVSACMMLVAACAARALPCDGARWTWWPLLPAGATLAAMYGYGVVRLDHEAQPGQVRVALIQGAIEPEVKGNPDLLRETEKQYFELTQRAVRENAQLDLIVWPETMFRRPLQRFSDDYELPPDVEYTKDEIAGWTPNHLAAMARNTGAALLLGIDRVEHRPDDVRHHNSMVFVARDGTIGGSYDKMHLVMFGEYVPLAGRFPSLYRLTPLAGGVTPGNEPAAFEVGGLRFAPNICYETVIPHLIRRHVETLAADDREPDVLVNATNDGWFRGSSQLDMHLACGVFRAVECRKPLLVAANTGFSAWIDGDGRVRLQGARRATDVLVADVAPDGRKSLYRSIGDTPAAVCLAATVAVGLFGLAAERRRRKAG